MKRVLITLLCAALVVSCATPTNYVRYSSNAEHMAAHGIIPTNVADPIPMTPTPPTASTGVSGWDVLGAAILFPLLLPVAMIANYPGPGVHCRSYTYKDQYHVKCY
jgi:hypothetical protein